MLQVFVLFENECTKGWQANEKHLSSEHYNVGPENRCLSMLKVEQLWPGVDNVC